jgi:3-hydroxyisobutyrate dehydrogenase-like beta-hydroxyacid dehydrogenase
MAQRVGFIGLGLMGHGMAKNLVTKGFALTFKAHRNRANLGDLLAAGANEVATHAEVARASDIVFLCVTGTPQVEEIVYGEAGLRAGAREGLIVVDCSTAEPASTARIRADLGAAGTRFVDAPLARTPKEAEGGRLNVMVGADEATLAAIRPALAAFAENIFHVGPPGHGHVLKLVNNFLALAIAASTAEALAVAARAGLDLQKVYEVVSAGGVNNGIFQMMVPKALAGDFTGMKFAIGNAQKDLRYYTHLTESLPVASFIAEAIHQVYVQAGTLGFGDRFIPSLIEAQERLNSISIVKR